MEELIFRFFIFFHIPFIFRFLRSSSELRNAGWRALTAPAELAICSPVSNILPLHPAHSSTSNTALETPHSSPPCPLKYLDLVLPHFRRFSANPFGPLAGRGAPHSGCWVHGPVFSPDSADPTALHPQPPRYPALRLFGYIATERQISSPERAPETPNKSLTWSNYYGNSDTSEL